MATTKRKFKKVLRTLDSSGFQPLPKRDIHAQAEALYENLWGMFGLTKKVRERKMASLKRRNIPKDQWPSVADYAWTAEVQQAFYDHPFHKAFVRKVKKMGGMMWGMWVLDAEPADFCDVSAGQKAPAKA